MSNTSCLVRHQRCKKAWPSSCLAAGARRAKALGSVRGLVWFFSIVHVLAWLPLCADLRSVLAAWLVRPAIKDKKTCFCLTQLADGGMQLVAFRQREQPSKARQFLHVRLCISRYKKENPANPHSIKVDFSDHVSRSINLRESVYQNDVFF